MTDFLFILILAAMFAFGFFVVRRLDKFLKEVRKANYQKREKSDWEETDKKH